MIRENESGRTHLSALAAGPSPGYRPDDDDDDDDDEDEVELHVVVYRLTYWGKL